MTDFSSGLKTGDTVKALPPDLLESGLTSAVVEVRTVNLATTRKITRI